MTSRRIIWAAALLLGVAAYFVVGMQRDASASNLVVVYKSPTCGCCGAWIEHMEASGFEVEVKDMVDVRPIKDREGVGPQLRSCHTATIGGYVLEGHVPAEFVVQMLAEQPSIRGLAVPGMPIGSPGMEQGDPANYQSYDVVAFDKDGKQTVYARVEAGS